MFENKKVLITGHTGFKGSWLTLWLLNQGAKICGISLPDSESSDSHFKELGLSNQIIDKRGDIRDREFVNSVFSEFQPEFVFHLAAQALVFDSYADPITTYETNVIGTMNIMEAIRATKSIKVAVMITSDKCYRNDEQVFGYKETDYLGGHDPYSASKSCAEIVAHSYFDSFIGDDGPACVTVRAGNVIGGGDWAANRIVPDCEKAWVKGEPVSIRSPYSTRPWQLVLEPLSGYLMIAALLYKDSFKGPNNHKLRNEAFNFGPPSSVCNTVEEVVQNLQKYWEKFDYKIEPQKSIAKECNLLKLCCDKALAYMGWEANLTFNETMEFTATWYRDFENNCKGNPEKVRELSTKHIQNYVELAKKRNRAWVELFE